MFKRNDFMVVYASVAEPYLFYAAPAPTLGKNFDAAPATPAPAMAPTLLSDSGSDQKMRLLAAPALAPTLQSGSGSDQ
jgi:hypothetical protein